MESKLTINQTYDAMLDFLRKMHGEFGWEHLGALLGSMALIDGAPMDVALVKDWSESAELAHRASDNDARGVKWTNDQAYLAMTNFLEQVFFNAKRENIGTLIRDMALVDGKPCNPALIEFWEKAIAFMAGGADPSTYVLSKNGVAYEVHRDTQNPKKN